MTIWDGYNETFTVDGCTILYRPMLRWERAAFRLATAGMPDSILTEVLCRQVESRIVAKDFECPTSVIPDGTFHGLWLATFGVGNDEREREDERNLYQGAKLYAAYPHLQRVSCEQCAAWWFNPLNGRTAKQMGNPLRRPPNGILLCRTEAGCPKGTREQPIAFSERNSQAYRHYQESGGRVPQDTICLRNARIIERAIQDAIAERNRVHPQGHGRAVSGSRGAAHHGLVRATGPGSRAGGRHALRGGSATD